MKHILKLVFVVVTVTVPLLASASGIDGNGSSHLRAGEIAENRGPEKTKKRPADQDDAPKPSGESLGLHELEYSGTGCPSGSVEIFQYGNVISVTWISDDFWARTSTTEAYVEKTCTLQMQVGVEPGMQIGEFNLEYLGFRRVPNQSGSYASFQTKHWFSGQKPHERDRSFWPGEKGGFTLGDTNPDWTACGKSTTFQISTSIVAQKQNASDREDVTVAVASMDIEAVSRPCESGSSDHESDFGD